MAISLHFLALFLGGAVRTHFTFLSLFCLGLAQPGFGHWYDENQTSGRATAEAKPFEEFCSTGKIKEGSELHKALVEVGDVMTSLYEITDPHYPENPDKPGKTYPFNSHMDWHSSVHAHVLGLGLARTLGGEAGKKLREKTLKRLAVDNLEEHHKLLLQHPKWELPYGRLWFLLLITELEKVYEKQGEGLKGAEQMKHDEKFGRLIEIRRAQEDALDSWLDPMDKNSKTLGGDLGAHNSALFSQILWQLSFSKHSLKNRDRVQMLQRLTSDPEFRKLYGVDGLPQWMSTEWAFNHPQVSFLHLRLKGNFYNVEPTIDDSQLVELAGKVAETKVELPKKVKKMNQHVFGREMTRLWYLGRLARGKGRSEACRLFAKAWKQFYKKKKYWAKKTQRGLHTSHWLPQFMAAAIMFSRSEW